MRTKARALAVMATACLSIGAPEARAAPPSSGAASLSADIVELSKGIGGMVGVAAWRLDGKGARIAVHGDQPFPMASTFKVAVAGAILAQVDAGTLKLDQMVSIDPADMIESDIIADRFIHPGVALSVHNLLELMLTESDNTATDALVRVAGGAAAVTGWVQKQGVQGQRIDRDTAGLSRDYFGLPPVPVPDGFKAARLADPKLDDRGEHPYPPFDDDPRDTSTPEAMGQLLTRIFQGKALSPSSTEILIGIMQRCRTGKERLVGRMPANTVIAHKTGTIGGTVNDVGVLTLPNDRRKVVIAVFIKKSDAPMPERERVIAEIARSVRDYYLFESAP